MRKLLGKFFTFGATNIISKNSEGIKSRDKSIFRHLFSKSKTDYLKLFFYSIIQWTKI